jgi:hypothetical protein
VNITYNKKNLPALNYYVELSQGGWMTRRFFLAGTRDFSFQKVQIGSGAHTASYSMGKVGYF